MIGVILAGGNSTRFGEDKSLYEIDGTEMYRHVADNLIKSAICDKIVISTNERLQHEFLEFETIIDDKKFKEHGPLTGIYSVAKRYGGEPLLVVSTDTPYIKRKWYTALYNEYKKQNHTVITKGEQLHPLVGIYSDEALLEKLEHQLESKKLSIRQFLKHINYSTLNIFDYGLVESDFKNINNKSDI